MPSKTIIDETFDGETSDFSSMECEFGTHTEQFFGSSFPFV